MTAAARGLARRARSAALATSLPADQGGEAAAPYASLVTIACDTDGAPILLLSQLADHTRNLHIDPRACLLIEGASRRSNPQTGPRVSLLGRITASGEERHRLRFLARHPGAALYAGFADFAIYRMQVERVHYVGGFARARWMGGEAFLCSAAAAAAVAAAEADILAHINQDHADAVALYAKHLLRRRGNDWRMIAVDPDGCDLRAGNTMARLDFPHPVGGPAELREVLVELAATARAKAKEEA